MSSKKREMDYPTTKEIKDQMTFDQLIRFVNTPYPKIPDFMKDRMTKQPQLFNFIKMNHPNMGKQQETFAARLVRYRKKYRLSTEDFALIANEFAKIHGTKITTSDIINYEYYNICPKIDKMTAIVEATGMSLDYFAGYGTSNRKSKNSIIECRAHLDPPLSISYLREIRRRKGVRNEFLTSDDSPTIA